MACIDEIYGCALPLPPTSKHPETLYVQGGDNAAG